MYTCHSLYCKPETANDTALSRGCSGWEVSHVLANIRKDYSLTANKHLCDHEATESWSLLKVPHFRCPEVESLIDLWSEPRSGKQQSSALYILTSKKISRCFRSLFIISLHLFLPFAPNCSSNYGCGSSRSVRHYNEPQSRCSGSR